MQAKKTSVIEKSIGPFVAILIILSTFTAVHKRAELLTYDFRLNLRNKIFGFPPMDPDLGTIDINDKSIETEGRYQDWTREKYLDVISVLSRFGAHAVAFDVYFTEPSANTISAKNISRLTRIDSTTITNLLSTIDYDQQFRDGISKADNVYLAQFAILGDRSLRRSSDQDIALDWIRKNAPKLTVDPEQSTLTRIENFMPPLKSLREVSQGYAFAQTVADIDGTRRRYPLVFQYGDVLFPSLALLIACRHLDVPIQNVLVTPGKHIMLPNARTTDDKRKNTKIPIDDKGTMIINWLGRWEETFVHYPHILLRGAGRQAHLDRAKQLLQSDPSFRANPRELIQTLSTEKNISALDAKRSVITLELARWMEFQYRRKEVSNPAEILPSHSGPEQVKMFEQVVLNNRIAKRITENPLVSYEMLLSSLPNASPDMIASSEDYIRSLLVDGQVPNKARPLYYYPTAVYNNKLLTSADVEGKVLFYGLTGTGTEDLNVTPFQADYPMVGIYPSVVNTIVNNLFIRRIPTWCNLSIILAIGVLLSLAIPRLRVLEGASLVGALVVTYMLVSFVSFTHVFYWIEIVAPMNTLVVGYLAITIYGYVIKEQEKEFVQGAFGHYLAPAVVDQIMTNPDMVTQLGGEERVMTSFFSDVAAFSTISECLTPSELVEFINNYLSEMCTIIEEYGGTIDKFEGDAILAFFGAPVFFEDHAVRGCLSCIDQQNRMIELREQWNTDRSLPTALQELRYSCDKEERIFAHIRMGLTAGPMVVGNMGSRNRTDYTMMGDTVNLAARFESGQKLYGTGIMVNESIKQAVDDIVETRRLDFIQVVGKEEPVTAYEVLNRKGELDKQKSRVLELYKQGLEYYERFQFEKAEKSFCHGLELDPNDGPCILYASRCKEFAIAPPDDLVFRPESK